MSPFKKFYDSLPPRQQTDMSLAEDAWQAAWNAAWKTAWNAALNTACDIARNAIAKAGDAERESAIRGVLQEIEQLAET